MSESESIEWLVKAFSEGVINSSPDYNTTCNLSKIDNFFSKPMTISQVKKEPKNIIVFSFESLEMEAIGTFNKKCSQTMPYFQKWIQNGRCTENHIQAPILRFSVASLFAAECGFPPLQPYPRARPHTSKWPKCIGNIFKRFGYETNVYFPNSGVVHHKGAMFESRGYKVHAHSPSISDSALFKKIMDVEFPKLQNNSQKQLLFIETINTHYLESAFEDGVCENRLPDSCPNGNAYYDCDDQLLEKFFNKFEEMGLKNTTEVIIFGDHHAMMNFDEMFSEGEDRKIIAILPFHPKSRIKRITSNYDIAPTVLDLAGIAVEPPFPFGSSLVHDELVNPPFPRREEINRIYQIANETKGFRLYKPNCDSCALFSKADHEPDLESM